MASRNSVIFASSEARRRCGGNERSPKGPRMAKPVEDRSRGARMARRDEGANCGYVTEEQRRQLGWLGREIDRLSHSRALTLGVFAGRPASARSFAGGSRHRRTATRSARATGGKVPQSSFSRAGVVRAGASLRPSAGALSPCSFLPARSKARPVARPARFRASPVFSAAPCSAVPVFCAARSTPLPARSMGPAAARSRWQAAASSRVRNTILDISSGIVIPEPRSSTRTIALQGSPKPFL